eukprot:SAG31_NODE_1079_length_10031_cov_5.270741_6_plen_219_part_00
MPVQHQQGTAVACAQLILTLASAAFSASPSPSAPPSPPPPGLLAANESACGVSVFVNTLGYIRPDSARMVGAEDAAACCGQCLRATWGCASWSYQHVWTPQTPCHLSSYGFVKKISNSAGNCCGMARQPQPPPPSPAPIAPHGTYIVDTSPAGVRQIFEGVEVELQADSIGSDNTGMPKDGQLVPDSDPSTIGAPHDHVLHMRSARCSFACARLCAHY